MDISIRVFEDKDKLEYLNIANSMFDNLNESVLTFDEGGGYDWYKFVAEYDKKIIGFLGYYFASKERMEFLKNNNDTYFGFEHDYYIFNKKNTCNWEYGGVLIEYRKKGIFSKLMQYAENDAFQRGFNYMGVWATVPDFFEKRGYVRIKELPVVQDTDGTLTSMIKNLNDYYGH